MKAPKGRNQKDLSPRRRSIFNRVAALGPRSEDKNDDEAERAELLAADKSKSGFSTPRSFATPKSVTSDISSPQKEHFQGCLKLYAENKINKDNAWNLQLIDFMFTMLRKHDSRMENLQMASTTLDASARIYSFRVDAIHHDVLKMAGGLSKAVHAKRGKKADEEDTGNDPNESMNGEDDPNKKKKEKRKKNAKSSLSTNIQSQLNSEVEITEYIDPFFAQLAATTGDMTSPNRAFNVTLQIDDMSLEIILRSDVQYIKPEDALDDKLDVSDLKMFQCSDKSILTVSKEDQICQSFHGFSMNNWDPDDEEAKMDKTNANWLDDNLNLSQQTMAFDMNADVEPLPKNDTFVYADDDHQAVESDEEEIGIMSQAIRRDKARVIANLIDMRPSTQADGFLEYSYCSAVVGAWAGPSHWKLKNNVNRGSKVPERSHTITTVIAKKAPSRKKKQLDFIGEGMVFNRMCQKCPEYGTVVPAKIMIGRKTLSQGTAWNEKNFKTPIDKGFTMTHFRKFYLQESVMLSLACDIKAAKLKKEAERISDVIDYDYNNDNDTSYCPNSQPDGADPWINEEGNEGGDVHQQNSLIGDAMEMIEPPPKIAKLFIPYAMRAKKVDMKQLKSVTWKLLTAKNINEAEKENVNTNREVTETNFSSLYKQLPTKLSTNMKESLSISLSLLAVLHLANEKGLILENNADFTDFSIKPLTEKN